MTPLDVLTILCEVDYKDWTFEIDTLPGDRLYLQVRFYANGRSQAGRKWLLSPHMTRSEIVATVFKAVITAEEHEAREHFMYRGCAVYGPHIDVEALRDAATKTEIREVMPANDVYEVIAR